MRKHWIEDRLRRFGTNPYGENIYRVIWSENQLMWEYGKQVKKYGNGKDRWILEKWLPPETYDKDAWEKAVEVVDGEYVSVLGPFPSRGQYEHCYTFEGAEGQYCPVEESLVELICACIERGRMVTPQEKIRAHREAQEAKEKERQRIIDDAWQDAKPAVHAEMPDHIERFGSFDIQRQLQKAMPKIPDGFTQITEEDFKKLNKEN